MTEREESIGDLEGLERRFDLMKREVDELQIQAAQERTPWHRSPPVLVPIVISIAAFTFSIWSGYQADQRIERQDQHAARAELRGLIQRLQALPKEYAEIQRLYASDPPTQAILNGSLNGESQVLAQQAVELIDQLEGQVSASEYATTAYALATAGQPGRVEDLLTKGLAVARDAVTEVALLRQMGGWRSAAGDLDGSRAAFEEALRIYDKYPAPNGYVVTSTNTYTEYHWSSAALARQDCVGARDHLATASALAAGLAPNDVVRTQVESTAAIVASRCGPAG